MKTRFILFLLVFSVSELFAQGNGNGGGGGFIIGYGNFDVSDLHEFVPNEIRDFDNDNLLIGGMGHAFMGRFIIGGTGFALMGDKVNDDSLEINLNGGMGSFDIGYLILSKDKIKFFPLLGIGGGGYGLSIAQNKNVSVDQVVNNPSREINISKGSFMINLSLNLELIPVLTYDDKEESWGGFMTGLRVGYLYTFPTTDWSFTGGDITGGPNFGLSGFYASLIIGGFGYSANNNGM